MPILLTPEDWEWTPGHLVEDDEVAIVAKLFRSLRTTARRRGHRASHQRRTLDAVALRIASLEMPSPKISGRVGMVDGHPTRTSFFRIEVAEKASGLLRYTHRLGGTREEELEARGGMEALRFEALALERERELKNDRSARYKAAVYSAVIELPFEISAEIRADILQAIAAHFRDLGFVVTWAVHSHNSRGEEQPHGHLLIIAGPRGARPVDDPNAMKATRRFVAETINRVALEKTGRRLPREWHGGTLADTGIDRPPRPDIPRGLYRARQKRDDGEERGRPVSERVHALAAAADRIDAAYDRAVEAGRDPEPQGHARRRAKLAEREALIAELADQQRHAIDLERARDEVERAQRSEEAARAAQRDAAEQALHGALRELAALHATLRAVQAERDRLCAELDLVRDVTETSRDAARAAVAEARAAHQEKVRIQEEVQRARSDAAHTGAAHEAAKQALNSAGHELAKLRATVREMQTERDHAAAGSKGMRDVTAGRRSTVPADANEAHRAADMNKARLTRKAKIARTALPALETRPTTPRGSLEDDAWLSGEWSLDGSARPKRRPVDEDTTPPETAEKAAEAPMPTPPPMVELRFGQRGVDVWKRSENGVLERQKVARNASELLPLLAGLTADQVDIDSAVKEKHRHWVVRALHRLPPSAVSFPASPHTPAPAETPVMRTAGSAEGGRVETQLPPPAQTGGAGTAQVRQAALIVPPLLDVRPPRAIVGHVETSAMMASRQKALVECDTGRAVMPPAAPPERPPPPSAAKALSPLLLPPRASATDREVLRVQIEAMDGPTLQEQATLQVRYVASIRKRPPTPKDLQIVEFLQSALVEVRHALKARGLTDPSIAMETHPSRVASPRPSQSKSKEID